MEILGIDVGGSGIKGAPVNIETGKLLTERFRLATPKKSTPQAVAQTIQAVCEKFAWDGPIGCGFPSVIQHGEVKTAANIDPEWIGAPGEAIIASTTGLPVQLINDADAAGLAEVRFGAGKGVKGVIMVITIGTGLGSGLFIDGKLVPNTELGHLIIKDMDAEKWASDAARKREGLSWQGWVRRFNVYLDYIHKLFWPDLIILGGGASKKFDKFSKHLISHTPVIPASLQNNAGIVGAALAAEQLLKESENG